MQSQYLSTLSSRGQITIPKDLREKLKIGEGQLLVMRMDGDKLELEKAAISPQEEEFSAEEWETIRKFASQKGKKYSTGRRFLKSLTSN